MSTGCYSVDGSSSMVVAYRWEEQGNPRQCLSERFQSERDAEEAMGTALSLDDTPDVTVPSEVNGSTPFSWEVVCWSDPPKYERNRAVMFVRYGSPDDMRGVVALGWQGVTDECWNLLSLPTNEFFRGNRQEELDAGRSLYLSDVPSGVTAQWYSEPDETNDSDGKTECMAYVPGATVDDNDMLMRIAKGTRLV